MWDHLFPPSSSATANNNSSTANDAPQGDTTANNNSSTTNDAPQGDTTANNAFTQIVVVRQAAAGTREDPVIIEDDDIEPPLWTQVSNLWRNMSSRFSVTSTQLILITGFIIPLTILAPIMLNGIYNDQGLTNVVYQEYGHAGFLQLTLLAIIVHCLMAFAAYRVFRNIIDTNGGVGPYPGLARGLAHLGGRRKLTVSEIADIVYKVKVEEFVSPGDMANGECSISRMKRMLVNRGASDVAERCLERDELVQEIAKIRNYNEECCVCAEEYAEGDVMRVTHCKHEFHLHCFDKWIYTFADTQNSRYGIPTCPMCKTELKK